MSNKLSKEHLYDLRNRIPMIPLIVEILELIYKTHDGHFRFMCPLCKDFDSAVNTQTNLARCFRCERNFNPIDLIMIVKHYSFIQAVRYLQPLLQRIEARVTKKG
jgi:hypothetical protein